MISLILGIIIGVAILLYGAYRIDERNQFIWMGDMRKCKECNSYHHTDSKKDWNVMLKSSSYKDCDCYIFTKNKKL